MRVSAPLLLALASLTTAHMEFLSPPGLRSKHNPYTTSPDYDMKSPLSPSGADFPCRGHLSVLSSPQGASVASWAAGSQQTWTLDGNTRHEGGSCQVSISKDGGATWKVVHSYIGGCPLKNDWGFKVPADTPAGPALFAFSWHNRAGNREMYMNCASVTITGGGGRESVPFSSRPNILRAHAGTDCKIAESFDVEYPDPGPDVTRAPNAKLRAPEGGECGSSGPKGGGGSEEASPANTPFPGTASAGGAGGIPGGGILGGDAGGGASGSPSLVGACGGEFSCINSIFGSCCNAQGSCGATDADCGAGCQMAYGRCMDGMGNPNTGFTGRHSSGYVPEPESGMEWMVVVLAVVCFWMMF